MKSGRVLARYSQMAFLLQFFVMFLSQDLIETFTDVGRSWLKKTVRTVITSAASEAGLNLVIEPPSDKKILFVSVGVSEKEIKDRMMKLKVRAKAVVDALVAASKNSQLAPPKPLCSFLQRISSDGVYVMTPRPSFIAVF
jgi:hypothetical protein